MINWAFPLLNAVDGWLAGWLPLLARLCLWGALSGAAAMGLYALMSDQAALSRRKAEIRDVRRQMMRGDGEQAEVMRLARRNLALSFGLLGRVFGPAMLSGVPVIVIVLWLSAYHSLAPADPVRVDLVPPADGVTLLAPDGPAPGTSESATVAAGAPLRVLDADGLVWESRPDAPPVGVVHKRVWWNALIGNEAGYLRPDAAIDEIRFAFPRKQVLSGLPAWMSAWEFPYFLSLIAAAVALKLAFRIQ